MIDGIKVKLGEVEYTIPPLNFAALKRLQGKIESLDMSTLNMDSVAEIVLEAMKRNYPEMTLETLMEVLDMGNQKEIVKAVFGASGISTGEVQA